MLGEEIFPHLLVVAISVEFPICSYSTFQLGIYSAAFAGGEREPLSTRLERQPSDVPP